MAASRKPLTSSTPFLKLVLNGRPDMSANTTLLTSAGLNRFLGSSSVVICVDADASARNASRSSPKSSSVSSMQIISLQGDDLLSPVQFWSNRAIFFTAPVTAQNVEGETSRAVTDRPYSLQAHCVLLGSCGLGTAGLYFRFEGDKTREQAP